MQLNRKGWKIEHSVETGATLYFAWDYMTAYFAKAQAAFSSNLEAGDEQNHCSDQKIPTEITVEKSKVVL